MTPVATAAAAVSTCFTAFPYDLFWHGPVWPYAAGIALLPAMLAVVRLLLEPGGAAGPLAIGVGTAGLAALHTSVVFVVFVFCVLILLAVLFRFEGIDWRKAWPSLVAAATLAAVLGLVQVLPSLYNIGGVTGTTWPTAATVTGAVGQTVLFSPMADFPQWWIGLPAIFGLFLLVKRRKMLWLVGGYIVFRRPLRGHGLFGERTRPFTERPFLQRSLTGLPRSSRWPERCSSASSSPPWRPGSP